MTFQLRLNTPKKDKEAIDITASQIPTLMVKTMRKGNQEPFEHLIITNDDKAFTKEFSNYNNLKQLLMYDELLSGRSANTVKNLNYRLRELAPLEDEYQVPFYKFNQGMVQDYVNQIEKNGNAVHSVSTKLSILGRVVNELNAICQQEGLTAAEKNWWKIVNRNRKNGSAALQEPNEKQFITKAKLLNEFLPSSELEATIPILLVYKGLMLGTTDDTNEVMLLKWSDFEGNQIKIKGKRARTINFDNDEMAFINQYRKISGGKTYVMSPNERNRGDNNRPITRWTVISRMAQVAQDLGMSKRSLGVQNVRLSGQLNWILQERVKLYGPQASREQLYEIIRRSYHQFGEPQEKLDKLPRTTWENRRTRIILNLKQFSQSTKR